MEYKKKRKGRKAPRTGGFAVWEKKEKHGGLRAAAQKSLGGRGGGQKKHRILTDW